MTRYDIRENDSGYGFSPTDKPDFVIWRSVDEGPWHPFSGGHSREFCERAVGFMSLGDSVTHPPEKSI